MPTKNNDVYEIANAGNLFWFAGKVNLDYANFCDAKAKLTQNVVLNSDLLANVNEDGTIKSGYSVKEWSPIVNYNGNFDGAGYTISGVYFEYTLGKNVNGLFASLDGGTASNVILLDSYAKGIGNISSSIEEDTTPSTEPVTPCSDGEHTYVNGFCSVCDSFEAPVLTTDKYDLDGDGTKDEVYEIANAGNLYWFRDRYNADTATYRSKNLVLTNDIIVNEGDLSGCEGKNKGNWRTWSSIYKKDDSFAGIFDGQNYEISGLFSLSGAIGGLIYCLGEEGVLRNLGIVNSYFGSQSDMVSFGVFVNNNHGLIENCYNKDNGYASVYYEFGGIACWNYNTIRNCYNDSDYYGDSTNWGIAGICTRSRSDNSLIENCYNSGNLFDNTNGIDSSVAGIVVHHDGGTIRNCYNTGDLSSYHVAGIAKSNGGVIENCYNTGNIYSRGCASGICSLFGGSTQDRAIQNCYNTGIVYSSNSNGYLSSLVNDPITSFTSSGTSYDLNRIVSCYSMGYTSAKRSKSVETQYYGLFRKDYLAEEACIESFTNCYYLSYGTENTNSQKYGSMTLEQFQNGEIAYLLSQSVTAKVGKRIDGVLTITDERTFSGDVWGQTLTGADRQYIPALVLGIAVKLDGNTIIARNETQNGAMLVVGAYNDNGRLVDIKTTPVPSGERVSTTLDELGINTQNVASIKAMLWNNLSLLKPLVPFAVKNLQNQINE